MRKLVLASLVALLVPTASFAQFQLGARIGYAPAMGDAYKEAPMSDGVKSQIPLQLDALYKVMPDLAVGAYLAYGFGQLNSDVCPDGLSCSATDLRLGFQAVYSFNQVKAPLVPWAGLALGYDIATVKVESFSTDTTGFDLALQAGGDYKVNDQFTVGPYLQVVVGQYGSVEGTDIPEKALHQWLGFGVAGKFSL